jgi:hypothetical protein
MPARLASSKPEPVSLQFRKAAPNREAARKEQFRKAVLS